MPLVFVWEVSKGFAVVFNFAVLRGGAEGKRDKGRGFGRKGKRRRGVFGNGCLKWGLIGSDDAGIYGDIRSFKCPTSY